MDKRQLIMCQPTIRKYSLVAVVNQLANGSDLSWKQPMLVDSARCLTPPQAKASNFWLLDLEVQVCEGMLLLRSPVQDRREVSPRFLSVVIGLGGVLPAISTPHVHALTERGIAVSSCRPEIQQQQSQTLRTK